MFSFFTRFFAQMLEYSYKLFKLFSTKGRYYVYIRILLNKFQHQYIYQLRMQLFYLSFVIKCYKRDRYCKIQLGNCYIYQNWRFSYDCQGQAIQFLSRRNVSVVANHLLCLNQSMLFNLSA